MNYDDNTWGSTMDGLGELQADYKQRILDERDRKARRAVFWKATFLERIFLSKAVQKGQSVRRSLDSIDEYTSREAIKEEVKRRNFQIIEAGNQWIIICNSGRVKTIM